MRKKYSIKREKLYINYAPPPIFQYNIRIDITAKNVHLRKFLYTHYQQIKKLKIVIQKKLKQKK